MDGFQIRTLILTMLYRLTPTLIQQGYVYIAESPLQRQAVSLLNPEAPLVGTGLEKRIARDSRAVIVAREAGIVAAVDSTRIIVTPDGSLPEDEKFIPKGQGHVYRLFKYLRSNAGTCINQRPVVRRGDKVEVGTLLADGDKMDK